MQDRYAGDVGDFGKLGLLRHLVRSDAAPSSLGVLWWLVPDEGHNADGKHVAYLTRENRLARSLRACDSDLVRRLQCVVSAARRCVAALEEQRVLPSNTRYYSQALAFVRGTGRAERQACRQEWLRAGLATVAPCDLVFADPDNGLEVPSTSIYSLKGPKYVFFNDLLRLKREGRSLVIYHHIGRKGRASEQVEGRRRQLARELSLDVDVRALLFRRGSSRAFFVLPDSTHEGALDARIASFLKGPWGGHFKLV